jgi:hypothetical protein
MAHLHTSLPTHYGEKQFAKQLELTDDDKLHLWFAIDSLPGVPDIDAIVWHEEAGVFVVEIKAITLDMLIEFGHYKCKIRDRTDDRSPQRQAYDGQEQLLRYLAGPRRELPFFVSTVCWPKISRRSWRTKWETEHEIRDLADRMLFEEDVSGPPEDLKRRLIHIYEKPPIRSGSNRPFQHSREQFERFKTRISKDSKSIQRIPSDLEKLRHIEKNVESETKADAPTGRSSRILYAGGPGTGKTFRLLRIGWHHAINGKRVLYACFNKVLASDLRRISHNSQLLKSSNGTLVIRDVFDICKSYCISTLGPEGGNADEWGSLILEYLKSAPQNVDQYDTVLIDEVQDMQQWHFELLDLHATKDATVCVAHGKNQELYSTWSAQWLTDFEKSATSKNLRRVFRNTLPIFQLSQVFYQAAPNLSSIAAELARFKKAGSSMQREFEFARSGGSMPTLLRLDDRELEGISEDVPWFSEEQTRIMVAAYEENIRDQLDRLQSDQHPIDLLILVPAEKSLEAVWTRQALHNLKVEFTDYTVEECRRDVAKADAVRLCTFHSARGIEGHRVVVFGFDRVDKVGSKDVGFKSLGYVALSRAVFDCTVAFRHLSNSPIKQFVVRAIQEIVKIES